MVHVDRPVFSPNKIQGMIRGRGVGEVCDHNKGLGLSHSPHQREICTEGLLGRHALGMLGRTLDRPNLHTTKITYISNYTVASRYCHCWHDYLSPHDN